MSCPTIIKFHIMNRRLCLLGSYRILKNIIFNTNILISRSALKLAHKIHGPNPSTSGLPVIVLHGLLGSKKNWESMCKKITASTKQSVVAVDARNHGESPHDSSHTYPELASDVSYLMSSLSITRASLIGHSMGGRTAMVMALTEPSKIGSMVIADISPVSTAGILNDFFPRLIDVMKSVNFQGVDNIIKAKKVATDTIIASGLIDNVQGMSFILMNIGTKSDKTFGWMCNVDALKTHFTDIAQFPPEMSGKMYSGPTLFIGGEKSNYIPLIDESMQPNCRRKVDYEFSMQGKYPYADIQYGRRGYTKFTTINCVLLHRPDDIKGIKVFFPKAELKYIAGVGHNVHAEDPLSFHKMVVDFLSKN